MRPRFLIVAGVAVSLGAPAGGGATPGARPPGPPLAERASRDRVPPDPGDSDLEAIRDIFRFADEVESRPPGVLAERERSEAPSSAPTSAPGARLIGLVRRSGGLRAALALEGEVVLLGPDESALGYTVLDVSEERVVVRDPGGKELTLGVGPS